MQESRLPFAALVAALAAAPVTARAQSAAEPIRVDYAAPAECPSAEDFLAAVLSRTPRARRAPERGPARTFVVTVERRPGVSTGHLVIRATDGSETERDVDGDTCEEVASALALMAALTIDPNASTSPAPPTITVPPAFDGATPAPREAPARAASPETRWRFGASVGVSVDAGLAPSALVGAPIAIHAVAPASGVLAPTFHLAFERTSSGSLDVTGGTASFVWTAAVAEACPHRWSWGKVSVEPCVRVEAGALVGHGGAVVPAREDARAWGAIGAMGHGEWRFAEPFHFAIDAGLRAPLQHTTYYFEPDTTIYRVPEIAGIAGAAVGVYLL